MSVQKTMEAAHMYVTTLKDLFSAPVQMDGYLSQTLSIAQVKFNKLKSIIL